MFRLSDQVPSSEDWDAKRALKGAFEFSKESNFWQKGSILGKNTS